MLVTVAVMFLVLRLPYLILFMICDFMLQIWGHDLYVRDPWLAHRLTYARDICDVIATLNFAINFFLYCLTGSQFRASIVACFKGEKGGQFGVSRQTTRVHSGTTDVTNVVRKEADCVEMQSLMQNKK